MIPKRKRGRPRKNPEISIIPPTKIKRIKLCVCQKEVGRKVRTCPHCGHKFEFKKLGKYEEIKNWKQLLPGDIFYINKGGLGPYYITQTEEKILFGYRGKFKVLNLDKDGIISYSAKNACCFIYMGKKCQSEMTGIFKRKHKLWKRI